MAKIQHYLQDGANYQARAVLCLLQNLIEVHSELNEAEITVARWENCREQGYIVTKMLYNKNQQLNIAWFQERNSDFIGAIKWVQYMGTNSPTMEDFIKIDESKVTTFSSGWGECMNVAEWIRDNLK